MKSGALKKIINACVIGGLALATATPAISDDRSAVSVGASVGQSQANIAKGEIVADLLQSGFTTTLFKKDETDLGFNLLVGYQFNQYFAIEGGYFDLGEFGYKATTIPAGSKAGKLGFKGWNLDLLGMLPVSERSTLFARVGGHRGETDVIYTDSGAVTTVDLRSSKTDTNYKFGVGHQYAVTDALALRLEAERYRMDDAVGNEGDLDMISAGFTYQFPNRSRDTEEPVQSEQTAA